MKIYISNSILSFNIKIGDATRRIVFSPLSTGGGQYASFEKEEQEALEKHPFFDAEYKMLQETNDEEPENPITEVGGISKCADAIAYLKEQGVTAQLRSKEQIIEAAKGIGIKFTEL